MSPSNAVILTHYSDTDTNGFDGPASGVLLFSIYNKPAMPAIKVKALSLIINNPIITNASQIPIPPPLGVGRECELRILGLSIKAKRWPILEIAAAQNRLKRKGRIIVMNIMK